MKTKIVQTFCVGLFFLTGLSAPAEITSKKIEALAQDKGHEYVLNTLLVSDGVQNSKALIVMTHGAPVNAAERPSYIPENMLPQAEIFAKMGHQVLIVERRGFGKSKEPFLENPNSACEGRDNMKRGQVSSADILGALDYVLKNKLVVSDKAILLGKSAGGFTVVFAAGISHPHVIGVINFSGGVGGRGTVVCSWDSLKETLVYSGSRTKVPSLWIYAENDKFYAPELITKMHDAFQSQGGSTELHVIKNQIGHGLFELAPELWTPVVQEFINRILN